MPQMAGIHWSAARAVCRSPFDAPLRSWVFHSTPFAGPHPPARLRRQRRRANPPDRHRPRLQPASASPRRRGWAAARSVVYFYGGEGLIGEATATGSLATEYGWQPGNLRGTDPESSTARTTTWGHHSLSSIVRGAWCGVRKRWALGWSPYSTKQTLPTTSGFRGGTMMRKLKLTTTSSGSVNRERGPT